MAVSEKMVDAALDAAEFVPYQWREMPFADRWQARMRRALEAADAVRGGDAAPPAGMVPVRVAVWMDPRGKYSAVGFSWGDDKHNARYAWNYHPNTDGRLVGFLVGLVQPPITPDIPATIHAPLPAVPEVGAVVEDPTT